MILGVFERDPAARVDEGRVREALGPAAGGDEQSLWCEGPVALAVGGRPAGREGAGFDLAHEGDLHAALSGSLYPDDTAQGGGALVGAAGILLRTVRDCGDEGVADLNGAFAGAVYDRAAHRLRLYRDPLGIEAVFVHAGRERLVFGSTLAAVARCAGLPRELDREAVVRFMLFNYNPGLGATLRGVEKLRPGECLEADRSREQRKVFWRLSFANPVSTPEAEIADELLESVRRAVRRRMPAGEAPSVFVSGGLDSSTVLGLIREANPGPLHTYSYRCKSESFDESHYARIMAESVGSTHTEVEYRPEDALLIGELATTMSEPFCDVGINIGTYLLGRQAGESGRLVFTGDGGDELFGGHPVYEADKIARFVDPVPGVLRRPVLSMMTWLPDSDQKKSLPVKLKRFGESALFPPELLSHRWRLYYHQHELDHVLTPDAAAGLDRDALFRDVLAFNREADGPDMLSRTLYSDYLTVCDTYVRRNQLFRHLGIETRYPLFDRTLVEMCARIPSDLKIHGWFDTKYIFKKAIEKVLPREIVYREDKLGHSIPLKNWLRDVPQVREFVLDHLSPDSLRKRGLVRPEFVEAQVQEHMSKRRNNSHRLWTLAVLEMWCRHHLDAA